MDDVFLTAVGWLLMGVSLAVFTLFFGSIAASKVSAERKRGQYVSAGILAVIPGVLGLIALLAR